MTEIAEQRSKEGYPNPEEEKLDLARMDKEAEELVALAWMLVQKAQDGYRAVQRGTVRAEEGKGAEVPGITMEQVASNEGEVSADLEPG